MDEMTFEVFENLQGRKDSISKSRDIMLCSTFKEP